MSELAPFLVPISLFFSVAAVFILRGPFGKALADRVSGNRPQLHDSGETEALHAEVDDLRYRLSEVEERLDFTERLLAKGSPRSAPPLES